MTAIKRDKNGTPAYMQDFFNRVSMGGVANHRTTNVYSRKDGVGTSFNTIWTEDSIYSFPSSAAQWSIASDNANDSSAGTGLRKVVFLFLDEDYNSGFEIITLNGQTPVTTTAINIKRFVGLIANAGTIVGEVGSTGSNVGTVYVGTGAFTAGKPANVYGAISPTKNVSEVGIITVPLGKQLSVNMNIFGVESTKSAIFSFDLDLGGNGIFINTSEVLISEGVTTLNLPHFLPAPEKSDIRVSAKSVSGTVNVNFTWLLYEAPFPLDI